MSISISVFFFFLLKSPSKYLIPPFLCRLYNYGLGIHLLENPAMEEYDQINDPRPINPKDNHISFIVSNVLTVL